MPDVRTLVIATSLLARTGLAALLGTQPEIDIVGQTAGGETLLDDLDVYRPDVVIYDLGYEPAALVSQLAALVEAQMPVVALLFGEADAAMMLTVLNGTVPYGLLLHDSDAALLAGALVAVGGGLVVLDPVLAGVLVPDGDMPEPLPPGEELTPREFEVLQLLAEGLPNKAIAQALGISANTVKFHVNAILSKLDVQSRTEAVVRATQLGLIVL